VLANFPTVYLGVCEEFMGTEIHEKIFTVAGVLPCDFLNLNIKLLFIYNTSLPEGEFS